MSEHKSYGNPNRTAAILLMFITVIMIILIAINIITDNDKVVSEYQSLKFLVSGEEVKTLDLKQLQDKLETHKIVFIDPMYEKEKRYNAFTLTDVLEMGYGDKWMSSDYTDISFEALDGYTAIASTSKLSESGGYIAYSDLDFENWEPFSIKEVNPGPFYLVWASKNQTTANEYPWPWQLSSMNLVKFQDQYSAIIPVGVSEDSSVYKGYLIFKGRCIRCHSMNGEGGKTAPDLNAPQSITTYRNEYMIKEFIRHPSKYRHTQMPDHPDLSEQNLDDLIAYFNYMDKIRN